MKEGSKVSKMLSMMDFDTPEENLELLTNMFTDVKRVSKKTGKNLIQELVSRKYKEKDCLLAVRTLLIKAKLSPNHVDKSGRNFIQTAINTGYSDRFVYECIRMAIIVGVDLNHQDNDGNTLVHTMASATNYQGGYIQILSQLYGRFDIHAKNNNGKEFMDLVLESNKYNNEQKMKLIDDLNKLYSPSKKSKTSKRRNG